MEEISEFVLTIIFAERNAGAGIEAFGFGIRTPLSDTAFFWTPGILRIESFPVVCYNQC